MNIKVAAHTVTHLPNYTCKNEEDPLKNKDARVATTQNIDFSHSRADNSAVRGRIWLKLELVRDIVVILVTCKNEEDPLKTKDARVATTQNTDFSNTQGQITLQLEVGSGRNSNSFEILWLPLLLPRIKKIRNKNEGARVATTQNTDFFTQSSADNSAVKGRIWPKFKLIRDVIAILVTSKYEEDPIKVEGARVATTLNIDFSNTQGQITL